jgi:hypothetical protein
MEDQINFFSSPNKTFILSFHPFDPSNGLPFPLNITSSSSKRLLTAFLSFILLAGLQLKVSILSYLRTVNVKLNPINVYIWNDQLNGLILGFNIVSILIMTHLNFPMSRIVGSDFCNWFDVPGILYLSGATLWSCLISGY